jgi:tripartite-type tricarboxylate transporter receptor subunit TctC
MNSSFRETRTATRRGLLCSLSALALLGIPAVSWGQDAWKPAKPIKIVVPFPAGGGADVAARMVAHGMEARIGQAVIVENKTGAGGSVGADYVYASPADGTVLLLATPDAQAVYAHLNKVRFETPKFVPVGGIFKMPYVLMGRADLPAANVKELGELMRTKNLSMGNGGNGGLMHILAIMMATDAKAPGTLHVPFQGAAPGLQALVGGQIDLMMVPLLVAPQYRGKLRTYGVASMQRAESMKDVPTLPEQGYAVSGDSWGALVAPPGTPANITSVLSKALRDSVSSPDITKKIQDMSLAPIVDSQAEFGKFYLDEYRKWGEVIKASNIKVD